MSASNSERYLIISNISKKNNAYSLIQNAHVFGFVPILVGMPNIFPENRVKKDGGEGDELRYGADAPQNSDNNDSSSNSNNSNDNISNSNSNSNSNGNSIGIGNSYGQDRPDSEPDVEIPASDAAPSPALAETKSGRPAYIDSLLGRAVFQPSLDALKDFLKSRASPVPIVAIEIEESAVSVTDYPFTQSVAFMPGNEGTGLNSKQREISDGFIYIPQFGAGIESLNVTVATGVVLHQYCTTMKGKI